MCIHRLYDLMPPFHKNLLISSLDLVFLADINQPMNEIAKSLSEWAKERFSSSFFANYIFVWLIWNWQFVYITLFLPGVIKVDLDKFQYLYQATHHDFHIWCPLFVAFIFTGAFPWINSAFTVWKYWAKKQRRKWELELVDKWTPVSAEDFYEEKKKRMENFEAFNEAVVEANNLKAEKAERENEIQKLRTELSTQVKIVDNENERYEQLKVNHGKLESELEKSTQNMKELNDERSFPSFLLDYTIPLLPPDRDIHSWLLNGNFEDLKQPYQTLLLEPNHIKYNSTRASILLMRKLKESVHLVCEMPNKTLIEIYYDMTAVGHVLIYNDPKNPDRFTAFFQKKLDELK